MSRLDELLAQVPQEEIDAAAQEESGFFDVAGDILAAPFRGVEGAVQGIYNLGDMLTFDLLPDYDNRLLGESSTTAGGIVEGISQFASGMFVPGVGGLSIASKLGKLGKARTLLTQGSKTRRIVEAGVGGVVTDFAYFDGKQGRLSDLIQQNPSLQNPITEFLQSEEDDTQIEGRLKNAVEGLGLGLLADGIIAGAKGLRAGGKAKADGASPSAVEEAMRKAEGEHAPAPKTEPDDLVFEAEEGAFYHGTASDLDAGSVDPYATSVSGLYGPGLYLTDNPNVAYGYAKTRSKQAKGDKAAKVFKVNLGETNLIDLDAKAVDADPAVREKFEGFYNGALGFEGNLKESSSYFDNMTLGQIYEEATDILSEARISRDEALSYIDPFQGDIMSLGYDGFRHLGGGRVGKVRHNVAILFDPSGKTSSGRPNPIQGMEDIVGSGKPRPKATPVEEDATPGAGPTPEPPKEPESASEFLAGVEADDLTGKPPEELMNIGRVSDQDSAKRVQKATLDKMEAEGKFDDIRSKSFEEQRAEAASVAADLADATGDASLKNLQGVLKDKEDALTEALPALTAVRETLSQAAAEAGQIARKGARATSSEKMEFLLLQQRIEVLSKTAVNMQRAVARQLGLQRYIPSVDANVRLLPDDLVKGGTDAGKAAQDQLLRDLGGGDAAEGLARVDSMMEKFAAAADRNPMRAVGLAKNGGKLNFIGYWMNSILSGPTTHMVNIASGVFTTAFLPMERALGQLLTGNLEAAGREVAKYGYMFEAFNDSLSAAKLTLKQGENVLDSSVMVRDDLKAGIISTIDENVDDAVSASQKWITGIINTPSRFLAAEDEFFKQLNYRAEVKAGLYDEAVRRGLKGDEAAVFVADSFERVTKNGQLYNEKNLLQRADIEAKRLNLDPLNTPDQYQRFVKEFMAKNFDKQFADIAERGLGQAREATFTTPLTKDRVGVVTVGRAANKAVNELPILRFVLPFVRTPANLLDFFFKRFVPTEAGSMIIRKTRRDLLSSDPQVRAEFVGRMATGTMMISGGIMLHASGRLTGTGPRDPSRRALLEEAGWQPYSILVGDKYVSYRRFDPFAGFLAAVADYAEGASYAEEESADELRNGFAGLVFAAAQFNKNRSFFQGISNLLSAASEPERFGPGLAEQYAGSLVPSFLAQLKPAFGDPEIREVRGLVDAMRNRIPGLAEGLEGRRNIFGENVTRPTGPLAIDPFPYTEVKEDVISEEFMKIGMRNGISRPRVRKNGLDLTNYTNSKGQTAYDRWQELHGKVKLKGRTMRDAMSRLIRSRDYQRLTEESNSTYDSPRAEALRRLVSRYRAEAYQQLIREFDDLRTDDVNNNLNRKALRTGKSLSQLRALIGEE